MLPVSYPSLKKSLSSLQDFILVCFVGCRKYLLEHIKKFNMDSKVHLLYPFNYADWKPKTSAYLKRQCLFDVSIGALGEPKSYEDNIDWINYYGIMCFGMSPNIHHLIDYVEYPFELWRNLDKAFGL